MSDQDTLPGPVTKFFFDRHNFGTPEKKEEEPPPPPPPPTFSEAELEEARRKGYEDGRRAGIMETEAKREKFVAGLLDVIARDFKKLFDAEKEREARYESEAVAVALAALRCLFPALNARGGLDEVRKVVENVLETQKDLREITVEVSGDYVEDIRAYIEKTAGSYGGIGKTTVTPAENLGPGECRMKWHDGGAQRDVPALAAKIEALLQQTLADRPSLRDNGHTADASRKET